MQLTTVWNIATTALVLAAALTWWQVVGPHYSTVTRSLIVVGGSLLGFVYNGYFVPLGGVAMLASTAREVGRHPEGEGACTPPEA